MRPISVRFTNFATAAIVLFLLALTSSAALAFNEAVDLRDQQVYAMMQENKVILVDVRTEAEWRNTGIAKGALPISMLDKDFIAKIIKIRADNPGKPIAFICASGRRSSIVQSELSKRGMKDLWSVYGGMTGSSDAKGWIADGLPVVAYPAG